MAIVPDGRSPTWLSSVAVDKVAQPRYTNPMRVFEPRLLLPLILVLLGATIIVGLNLEDDADPMILQGQMQPLRANPEDKTLASVGSSSALHPSRTDSEIVPRSGTSVIDLVCVLRC